MYARLCQLNQQMILAAEPLDVNPTAVLLLQPLFLLVSPVGGTAAVLPRTRASEVSHSSPSATPLPRLPHLWVVPVWEWRFPPDCPWTHSWNGTRRGQHGQGTTSIGSVLYVERLTAGSTVATRKFLLITWKIIIPPPDNGDPPDGPPVFCEKNYSSR